VNPFDGRVVSNFIVQALRGEDLTVYGDGTQTCSFQYIHDLVDGLIALMNSSETRPVNLGNGDEFTILEFAHLVRDIVQDVQRADGIASPRRLNIIHEDLPVFFYLLILFLQGCCIGDPSMDFYSFPAPSSYFH
jgi:UDP-glucuronate decarboxylase